MLLSFEMEWFVDPSPCGFCVRSQLLTAQRPHSPAFAALCAQMHHPRGAHIRVLTHQGSTLPRIGQLSDFKHAIWHAVLCARQYSEIKYANTPGGGVEIRHFFPIPRYRPIARPRLITEILRSDPAIICFTGGAGSGKSVAALEVADRLTADGATGVWFSVSRDDRDFADFWLHLLELFARAGLLPPDSNAAELRLGGLDAITDEAVAHAFSDALNSLATSVVVVIDDLHLTESDRVSESLMRVVERTPRLRLITTSRGTHPALSGIEAQVRVPVREVREDELALTESEINALVAARINTLGEAERDAFSAAIHRETRGWPLAAHALLVEHANHSETNMAGSRERFIRAYVTRLVANHTPGVRRALWVSSLVEETSPQLLAAMLGDTAAADVHTLFEEADESGLVFWDDIDGTRWYRHHHLIRDELLRQAQRELSPQLRTTYYRRAAEALRSIRPGAAINAAIQGEAWGLLSELLLESVTVRLTRARRPGDPSLQDIPAAVRATNPVLAAFALIDEYAYPRGRFMSVLKGLSLLSGPSMAAASEQPGLHGVVASVLRMAAARLSGNEELSLRMADQADVALQGLDANEAARYAGNLARASTQRAITYLYAHRFDDAELSLLRFQSYQPTVAGDIAYYHLAHRASLDAFVAAWRGRMHETAQRIAQCETIFMPMGWRSSYIGTGYRVAAAFATLEHGEWGEDSLGAALEHLDALAEHEPTIEHWPYLVWLRTVITELQHGPQEALARLDGQLAERRKRFRVPTTPRDELQALRTRLIWQSGRVELKAVRAYRANLPSLYAAISQRDYPRARAIASGLLSDPKLIGFPRRRAELLLLNAYLALETNDEAVGAEMATLAAATLTEQGLTLPYRVVPQAAVEHFSALLPSLRPTLAAQLPNAPNESSGATIGALTAAETRALAALAEHGTVPAASAALFLSPNTVRKQLKGCYRKLGVNSKADAIRVAREEGLLDPPASSTSAELARG